MTRLQLKRSSYVAVTLALAFLASGCSLLAPPAPANPSPADGTTGVVVGIDLGWDGASGGTFNVYLGTSNPPPMVASGVTMEVYSPPGLLTASTVYYWRIDTVMGLIPYEGPVWTFTTG